MQSCFFIGHADAPESIKPALKEAVKKCIEEYGVSEFIVGHYGCFDRMAAGVVKETQKDYPDIQLQLLLLYISQKMNDMLKEYDGFIYPEGPETVPKRYAILRANQWTVKKCDVVIVYLNHTFGGDYKTYSHVKKSNKTMIHLGLVTE